MIKHKTLWKPSSVANLLAKLHSKLPKVVQYCESLQMTLLIFLINAFYYHEGLGRLVAMPEKKAKKKAPKKIVIRGKRPRDPNQLAKWDRRPLHH